MAAVLYIPGAVFELALPLWLIVKGFNEPTTEASVDSGKQHAVPERVHV